MRVRRLWPVLLCLPILVVCFGSSTTSTMSVARREHTATLLLDGRILVVGGEDNGTVVASAELYDPVKDTWTTAGALSHAREHHTATLLTNGEVLVAGGSNGTAPIASAELYDPATNTWSDTGSLVDARSDHTATLLADGRVLIAGGLGSSSVQLANTELYDPNTGTFSFGPTMNDGRAQFTATRLQDGTVLVVGGQSITGPIGNAELLDAAASVWTPTGSLATPRFGATATLLQDGKVLVAAGADASGALNSAELYDPTAGTWSSAGTLTSAREEHTAVLLPVGDVFVIGGRDASNAVQGSVERYTESSNTWTAVTNPSSSLTDNRYGHTSTVIASGWVVDIGGNNGTNDLNNGTQLNTDTSGWTGLAGMTAPRESHTATLLTNGQVLVMGGTEYQLDATNTRDGGLPLASTELFDPSTNTFTTGPDLSVGRYRHTANLLEDGTVLAVGGFADGGVATATAERFDPVSSSFTTAASMAQARAGQSAVTLPSGEVLVTGGVDEAGNVLSSAELYDPTTDTWRDAGTLAAARALPVSVVLPSGQVLIAGGVDQTDTAVLNAELYDPGTGAFSDAGTLTASLAGADAVVLEDGQVVFGPDRFQASQQLFDPTTGSWTVGTSSQSLSRLAPLPLEQVLLTSFTTGSVDYECGAHTGICREVGLPPAPYTPTQGSLTATLDVPTSTLTTLTSGLVLTAGGVSSNGATVAAAQLFTEGESSTWRPTLDDPGSLVAGHSAKLTGTQLTGIGGQDYGAPRSSSASLPHFVLRSPLTGNQYPVSVVEASATQATISVPNVAAGRYILNVAVNGLFAGRLVTISPDGAPSAADATLNALSGVATTVTLSATDPEGDALTYAVVSGPSHGTLSGTAPNLTYTSNPGFAGADSFTFRANDGLADSNVATVTLDVSASSNNVPPTASDASVSTAEGQAVSIALSASDANGDALTYQIVTGPAHGTLSGTAPQLTYTPASGYSGPDSFTFQASDGRASSNVATVSITVSAPANHAPVDTDAAITTSQDTAVAVHLSATDADGDALTYVIEQQPQHGTLSGNAPSLTYTPAKGFTGSDRLTFHANDGKVDGNSATVTITVKAPSSPPASSGCTAPGSTSATSALAALGLVLLATRRRRFDR